MVARVVGAVADGTLVEYALDVRALTAEACLLFLLASPVCDGILDLNNLEDGDVRSALAWSGEVLFLLSIDNVLSSSLLNQA